MHLNKRTKIQLILFAVITLLAGSFMSFRILDLPNLWFGIGHYRVDVELANAAGLYKNANVTYRGTTIGRVDSLELDATGVTARLSLTSGVKIPADVTAQVHSQTALGENFIELTPRSASGPTLTDGATIPLGRTEVPPDINALLSATNSGLQAIPHDNLKTAVDEAYQAVGGLGPQMSEIVRGSTKLAIDANHNLDSITTLIDGSKPILDSQTNSADSIEAWAANVATVSGQLRDQDAALRGALQNGPGAFGATKDLLDRLGVSLPILLSNLVNLSDIALVYQPNIEQLLVLLPPAVELIQGSTLAARDNKNPLRGIYLSFNLNLNIPPPCTTGFLPAQQVRTPSATDHPDRPSGDLYCRTPQDGPFNVRGAKNLPCETRPGKRAPTVKMCESDENYEPLNDGYNWKGDPNATLSGQPVPQGAAMDPAPPAAAAPPVPPIATAVYDPATGSYLGPDGRAYVQSNLARDSGTPRTWQDMLTPPEGH